MAYRGKIGFHFPGRGNANIDAGDIKFLPVGITNPTSNDLVQIDKVYAIPAGVTITSVSQLQNYIVWEKIVAYNYTNLNNGNQSSLLFKWIAPQNVNSITDVTIWTTTPGSISNRLTIFDSNFNIVYVLDQYAGTWSNTVDSLLVSGNETTVNKCKVENISISITSNSTYYIYISPSYYQNGQHVSNYVYTDVIGDYVLFNGEEWRLYDRVGTQLPSNNITTYSNNKVKAEINGVSI